jgi:hypothetical protein
LFIFGSFFKLQKNPTFLGNFLPSLKKQKTGWATFLAQSHWNDEKNNRLEAKKKLVCMRENAESVDRIEIYELDRRRA